MTARAKTEYKGCQIDHMAEVECKSVTATINENEKLRYEGGKLAVDWLSHSYKYGNEIQLVYYTRQKPVVERRVDGHNDWERIEIHLSPEQALKIVRALK